ncbi:MAG: hypothetical protein WCQ64_01605, partial [Acidobacteriota bacterium]
MDTTADLLLVAVRVAQAIERCGLRYSVGGSLASTLQGEPRSTLDVDVLVELPADRVDALVQELGADFFVDHDSVARAVRQRTSVNIFHQPTSIKVDLFVAGGSTLERAQLQRRARVRVSGGELFVHSPEDILLQKLWWYQLGGEASGRQWRDILGILKVQQGRLDMAFLRTA